LWPFRFNKESDATVVRSQSKSVVGFAGVVGRLFDLYFLTVRISLKIMVDVPTKCCKKLVDEVSPHLGFLIGTGIDIVGGPLEKRFNQGCYYSVSGLKLGSIGLVSDGLRFVAHESFLARLHLKEVSTERIAAASLTGTFEYESSIGLGYHRTLAHNKDN
jgi:hypothetical protein